MPFHKYNNIAMHAPKFPSGISPERQTRYSYTKKERDDLRLLVTTSLMRSTQIAFSRLSPHVIITGVRLGAPVSNRQQFNLVLPRDNILTSVV